MSDEISPTTDPHGSNLPMETSNWRKAALRALGRGTAISLPLSSGITAWLVGPSILLGLAGFMALAIAGMAIFLMIALETCRLIGNPRRRGRYYEAIVIVSLVFALLMPLLIGYAAYSAAADGEEGEPTSSARIESLPPGVDAGSNSTEVWGVGVITASLLTFNRLAKSKPSRKPGRPD